MLLGRKYAYWIGYTKSDRKDKDVIIVWMDKTKGLYICRQACDNPTYFTAAEDKATLRVHQSGDKSPDRCEIRH